MSDPAVPATPHPSAKVLRILGDVLFFPALVAALGGVTLAWLRVVDEATRVGLAVAAAAFALLLVAALLLAAGAVVEYASARRWRSVGGWVTRAVGIGVLADGVLLLAVAFVVWSVGRDEATANLVAGRLLSVGFPFLLAGGAVLAIGHAVARRVASPRMAGADAALGVVVLALGFALANPWAVGIDLDAVVAAADQGRGYLADDALQAGRLSSHWFNGTLQASLRTPVTGSVNGPSSDSIHEVRSPFEASTALVEVAWEGGPENLKVHLEESTPDGWKLVHEAEGPSPLALAAPVTGAADYRARVFLANDGAAPEVAFTEVVSFLSRFPTPEDFVLARDA